MTGEPTSDDVIDPDTGKTLTNALGHSMGTKVIGVMAKGDQVTDKWCNSIIVHMNQLPSIRYIIS